MSEIATAPGELPEIRDVPKRRWSGVTIDPVTAICLFLVVLFVFAAVFADVLAPYKFTAIDLKARGIAPVFFGGTTRHILGTDDLGRDVLSRLFFAMRTSMSLALGSAFISLVLGTFLGLAAAFRGGVADAVIRIAVDFQASIPFIIFALAVLAFLGNSLLLFMALLGLYWWERYARLVRTATRIELERGYVGALRRNGASGMRIAAFHILPNILPVILVNLTVVFPELILLESSLSFLGLGIQPPLVSLGNMVGLGRDNVLNAWWIATIPGFVIFILALSISMLGDWLRDTLDPTLR